MLARNTIDIFLDAKRARRKVTMLTCYDYTMATIIDQTDIDSILVGDSVGMTMLGYESTLPVSMDDILSATKAVVRGTSKAFVVADMPFMSYQASFEEGMRNAGRLISEGGAGAVKIEGASSSTVMLIGELVDHGIPVIGHLGLTPQMVNQYGGYKARGKEIPQIAEILLSCERYADAGVKAVVLECVPAELAKHITMTFPFATIGIGAGADCDGEVQVIHDILGLSQRSPKHSTPFVDGRSLLTSALDNYDKRVKEASFPADENVIHVDEVLISKAEDFLDGLYESLLDDNEFIDN